MKTQRSWPAYEFEYTKELAFVSIDVSESLEIQAEVEKPFRRYFENGFSFAREVMRNQVHKDQTYAEVIRNNPRQRLFHYHTTPIDPLGVKFQLTNGRRLLIPRTHLTLETRANISHLTGNNDTSMHTHSMLDLEMTLRFFKYHSGYRHMY